MELPIRETGVISYAGLDEADLLEVGKRALARADAPERLRGWLPLFPAELVVDMPYIGPGEHASREGFSMETDAYHLRLSQSLPGLYAGENRQRCLKPDGTFRGGVVAVDEVWADAFAQYRPFVGERLALHMIGGGHQAVAVPESVALRLQWLLTDVECELGVTQRCQHYASWMLARLRDGEAYDAAALEAAYLKETGLRPFGMGQEELSRAMQEMAILSAVRNGGHAPLYTAVSRLAASIPQYVPFRRACDLFEEAPVTRQTARLMQLYFEGDGFQSDFWLPWADAQAYLDKRRNVLDVRALCEGFQLAPAVDVSARGGAYPTCARVVTVVDRTLRPRVAETVNNPAYGSGMNLSGRISQLIYLPDSAALLRDGRLTVESHCFACENTRVDEEAFLRMRALAEQQEHKGRLIDALYCRESALGRMRAGSLAYEQARALLDARVERLSALVKSTPPEGGQLSGYDADLAYLTRMAERRLSGAGEPLAPDAYRDACLESGYAMRARLSRLPVAEVCAKPAHERVSKPAPRRQQAANGQWFEQMDFLGDAREEE